MRYWAAGFLLTVLLFGGALLGAGKDTGTSRPVPDAVPGQTGTVPGQSAADGAVLLRVWDGEQVVEMTMAEYLPGVVRGEMPASFHQQALDAQAVAERTFICYHMASGRKAEHPDADVCMDYHCCNAYTSAQAAAEKWGEHAAEYEAKVQQAVRDTDGQVILYNGQPILAAFHSSSAGVTANSGDVWVSTLPYLHSVKSPEGEGSVPNYYSVRELPAAEFQQTFLAAHPEASFAGAPETWITGRTENASGRVETVTIGGVTVEGTEVRSLYGLRSACFTAEAAADRVTFHVTGFGHGVGMSQYGANQLAAEGKTWQDIVHWYCRRMRQPPLGRTAAAHRHRTRPLPPRRRAFLRRGDLGARQPHRRGDQPFDRRDRRAESGPYAAGDRPPRNLARILRPNHNAGKIR